MAIKNTHYYWKKHEEERDLEAIFPLEDEIRKFEEHKIPRRFRKYKNPRIDAIERNRFIREIKMETKNLRNDIRKR